MTADNPEQPKEQAVVALSPLMQIVSDRLGEHILEHHNFRGDDRIHIKREEIVRVGRILRDDPAFAFNMLMDVTVVDYLGQPDDFETKREVWDRNVSRMRRQPQRRHELVLPPRGPHERFAVVYHLNSLTLQHRLRIKCRVPEDDPTIDSLTPIWPGANWLEREAYDLYGIRFNGHPDLRRIYLYDEFVGHPLRKDYHKHAEQPIEPYAGPGAKEPRRPN